MFTLYISEQYPVNPVKPKSLRFSAPLPRRTSRIDKIYWPLCFGHYDPKNPACPIECVAYSIGVNPV